MPGISCGVFCGLSAGFFYFAGELQRGYFFLEKRYKEDASEVDHFKNFYMALIKTVRDFTPKFGNNCFLAENATIIGEVIMGDDCSVWFQAVVRGDVNFIRMGNKVNIQDGAIIHGTYLKAGTTIGNNVSIGHRALVHGCTIRDNVLVGMGAIVMDNTIVEENVLIAAGAVVLENSHLETGYIYAGVPAKKIKPIPPEVFRHNIERIANNYVFYAGWFKRG